MPLPVCERDGMWENEKEAESVCFFLFAWFISRGREKERGVENAEGE